MVLLLRKGYESTASLVPTVNEKDVMWAAKKAALPSTCVGLCRPAKRASRQVLSWP